MKSRIISFFVILLLIISFMMLASVPIIFVNGDSSEVDDDTEYTESVSDSESETEAVDLNYDGNWTKNY